MEIISLKTFLEKLFIIVMWSRLSTCRSKYIDYRVATISKASNCIDITISRYNIEWDIVICFLRGVHSRLLFYIIFQLQYSIFFTGIGFHKKFFIQIFNYFGFFMII